MSTSSNNSVPQGGGEAEGHTDARTHSPRMVVVAGGHCVHVERFVWLQRMEGAVGRPCRVCLYSRILHAHTCTTTTRVRTHTHTLTHIPRHGGMATCTHTHTHTQSHTRTHSVARTVGVWRYLQGHAGHGG